MPKRKNSDLDYISAQIKKLKKKLKRAQKRNDLTSSSDDSFEECEPSALLGLVEPSQEEVNNAEPPEELTPDPDLNLAQSPSDLTSANSFVDQTNGEQSQLPDNATLDKDILEILGDDPKNNVMFGPEIHHEIASRLQHLTTSGLTKETKKELQQKYLLPANAVLLGAPLINPEIKATLSETLVTRDKAIEAKQKLLGAAKSCLATAASNILGSQNKDNETLKRLMDGCKILCEIQHSDTTTRRVFSASVLKKDVKSQILTSKIDKYLFGENLPEILKTAKAVSKSSAEIKVSQSGTNKKPQNTSKSNLNSKTPAGPSRKPPVTAQKTRQPVSHQSQPAKQYKPSSQQQKNSSNYRRT